MKTFIAVIDEQSFAEAARKRYRSAPQVSKEISWLEDELGTQLLIRTTRKLAITESGKQFYQYAKRALNDYKEMKHQLINEEQLPKGKLVVTLPVSFGENILLTPIMDFHKHYPDIKLELRFCNAYIDLIEEDVDIAVRTFHPGNKALDSEPLIQVQNVVLGSPDYFKRKGIPPHPTALKAHNCLSHSDMTNPFQWCFKNDLYVDISAQIISNSSLSLVHAAVEGLGCTYLSKQKLWVQKLLKNGRLITVLDDYLLPKTDVFICYRKADVVPLKVKLFVKLIKKYLGEQS